ncbi:flap endonuclease-1 [Candidatus Bathyarchaeota archaeon]|nr:flap endonuclease-1 [Candidatus Bathyarchaeota archaeon]MBS7627470.1 flap endonuclease-1 [Candidatus Bathyarchaeota archaeon]
MERKGLGVPLTPIVKRRIISLSDLAGKIIAIDANAELHQFLALIRLPDGSLLTDSDGNPTSHLLGLAFRTTRLILDYGIKPIFVFDGTPPALKEETLARRRTLRERAAKEMKKALAEGDVAKAFSKAVVTGRLTKGMIEDSKRLLKLLGIPYVQALGEAEAQAAYMTIRGDVWATGSKDYDSLLFGTPRLVRYITLTGREFLPSLGKFRLLKPELIELKAMLEELGISHEQLIDIAILIGTDFNRGVKGIGIKGALKLIKAYGSLENLPKEISVPKNYHEVRNIFLNPPITESYETNFSSMDEVGLLSFLCEEKNFRSDRVKELIRRMEAAAKRWKKCLDLDKWMRKA